MGRINIPAAAQMSANERPYWGIQVIPDRIQYSISANPSNRLGSLILGTERGREKFQGTGREVVWLDEECKTDIYFECLTRTNETGGIVYMTFTPLQGWTEV